MKKCYEITNLTFTGVVELTLKHENDSDFQAEVFLTEESLRTWTSVYSPSHHGSSIIFSSGKVHTYVVDVEIKSNIDPKRSGICKEYAHNEFDMCVDKIFGNPSLIVTLLAKPLISHSNTPPSTCATDKQCKLAQFLC